MLSAAVFGAGSWGTTFAQVLADAGQAPRVWARRQEVVDAINLDHANPEYLPGVRLPDAVSATLDPAEALAGAQLVVLALPAQSLREAMTGWAALIPPDAVVVSLAKGVELGTLLRMSQVAAQVGAIPAERMAVLSGPNLAPEIAARQPAATVVASSSAATARLVADACATAYFRTHTGADVVGAELGGAVKNVVAVAVGIAEGLGLGDNTKSTIITRGLAETVRLAVTLQAQPATLLGLAGVGDLIVTCMSPLSRNHRVGVALGQGHPLREVVADTRQTVEGLTSCGAVLALALAHGVDMPIVESVVAVVHDGQQPALMADALMSRERKPETV